MFDKGLTTIYRVYDNKVSDINSIFYRFWYSIMCIFLIVVSYTIIKSAESLLYLFSTTSLILKILKKAIDNSQVILCYARVLLDTACNRWLRCY